MQQLKLFCLLLCFYSASKAQSNFFEKQLTYPRVAAAYKLKKEQLKNQALAKGLIWPIHQLYIRSFKYDSQLEVWARNNSDESFVLFKTYKVCALSGSLGPKRVEGDYQVPEGIYYINEFNPKSQFHLSLGLNYPNAADKINSGFQNPGNEIYIHGTCTTVGCIPIQNEQMEELYLLAALANSSGQSFIPVHIFPIKFNNPKGQSVLQKQTAKDDRYNELARQLNTVFEYFEANKKIPLIAINQKGDYEMLPFSSQ
jgi:murein L,D-transpeptidase YafK